MKVMFKLFAFLYMIAPLIIIPYWAYLNGKWYLLIGILFSYFGSYTSFSPRLNNFTHLFLLFCIGAWIARGFSIHQYITFFFFCSLWGYMMAKIAEEYDQQRKVGTLRNDVELAANSENNPEYLKEKISMWMEANPGKEITFDIIDELARGKEHET